MDNKTVNLEDQETKTAYHFFYNRRHSTQHFPTLQPGQHVNIKLDGEKGWKTHAKVIAKAPEPKSYYVQTEQGMVACRNRRPIQEVSQPSVQADVTENSDPNHDLPCGTGSPSVSLGAPSLHAAQCLPAL